MDNQSLGSTPCGFCLSAVPFLCRNPARLGSRYKISSHHARLSLFAPASTPFSPSVSPQSTDCFSASGSPRLPPLPFLPGSPKPIAKETCPHLCRLGLCLCFGQWRVLGVEATIVSAPWFHKGALILTTAVNEGWQLHPTYNIIHCFSCYLSKRGFLPVAVGRWLRLKCHIGRSH